MGAENSFHCPVDQAAIMYMWPPQTQRHGALHESGSSPYLQNPKIHGVFFFLVTITFF